MPPVDVLDDIGVITDEDFELDLTVIESTTPLITMMCATSDNCGSTCAKSACVTSAAQPF
jgi:FxLD family lantipeptide